SMGSSGVMPQSLRIVFRCGVFAVGFARNSGNDLVTMLIKDLKLPRPIGKELTDARRSAVQIGGVLKPHGTRNVFPYDVVKMCFHIFSSNQGRPEFWAAGWV